MIDPDAFITELVSIRSHSGEEADVARFLVETMSTLNMRAHVDDAGNAVGIIGDESDDAKELVLLGHMDTVPGEIPVRVERTDEGPILHGRGSVDAKGPLATFAMAASRAALPEKTRVVVIGAVEEEAATSKGARHVATRYNPDACVIGEPSSWGAVTLGYKGRQIVEYELKETVSHSAGAETPAAERCVEWWNRIRAHAEAFNEEKKALFDQLLPSLRTVNTSTDGLHDVSRATVGLRLPPGFDIEATRAKITSWAGEASIEFRGYEPAYSGERTSVLARAFSRVFRERGMRPRMKHKTGTSDMNVVGPVWNCPILAYGPGDSSLDHTPIEHLKLDEYHKAIEVLTRAIETWRELAE